MNAEMDLVILPSAKRDQKVRPMRKRDTRTGSGEFHLKNGCGRATCHDRVSASGSW